MLIKAFFFFDEFVKTIINKGLTNNMIYDGGCISIVTSSKLSEGMGVRIDVAKKITDFLGLDFEDLFTVRVKRSKKSK